MSVFFERGEGSRSNEEGHSTTDVNLDMSMDRSEHDKQDEDLIEESQLRQRLMEARTARENATDEEIGQEGFGLVEDNVMAQEPTTADEPSRWHIEALRFSDTLKVFRPMPPQPRSPDHGNCVPVTAHAEYCPLDDLKWMHRIQGEFSRLPNLEKLRLTVKHLDHIRGSAETRNSFLGHDTVTSEPEATTKPADSIRSGDFDLLGSLCNVWQFMVEICKHLRPVDIASLYSASKKFHELIQSCYMSSMSAWARHMAPGSARIFHHNMYPQICIPDPSYRSQHVGDNRACPKVPNFRWLQMIVSRETKVRDILASLARKGLRLPPQTHMTLKKMWVIMDIPRNHGRVKLVQNQAWLTDMDLYLAQMFLIKLLLCMRNPHHGHGPMLLFKVMMGQKRGLSPLWALLRGKHFHQDPDEMTRCVLRYDTVPTADQVRAGRPVVGVELGEMGIHHLEGWGRGNVHLLRPDELFAAETARRHLDLGSEAERMVFYGHVDMMTGRDLVPDLDEMYMSDEDEGPQESLEQAKTITGGCGNVPFKAAAWKPVHARKARWGSLTEAQRAKIEAHDLRLDLDRLFWEDDHENIDRGQDWWERHPHIRRLELDDEGSDDGDDDMDLDSDHTWKGADMDAVGSDGDQSGNNEDPNEVAGNESPDFPIGNLGAMSLNSPAVASFAAINTNQPSEAEEGDETSPDEDDMAFDWDGFLERARGGMPLAQNLRQTRSQYGEVGSQEEQGDEVDEQLFDDGEDVESDGSDSNAGNRPFNPYSIVYNVDRFNEMARREAAEQERLNDPDTAPLEDNSGWDVSLHALSRQRLGLPLTDAVVDSEAGSEWI